MILFRQAVRSVWRGKKSYIACVVLMAVGIMVFVSFNLLYANLRSAMTAFYQQQRFGEAFAVVGGIPLSAAERIRDMDGIAQLDATLTADARVRRPDSSRIITLRVSSYTPGQDDRLNNFLLTEGVPPGAGEILLSETFAKANGFRPGDAVSLVVEGKEVFPVVSGTAQSPEYVYAIPDTGQLMPDDETFGYGYMTADSLGVLTGKSGLATNLSMTLAEDVPFSRIRPALEEALTPYGLKSLEERKNQPSHSMLQQEIDSLGAMAQSLPAVFILLAIVILYIMLKRIIEQERGRIGVLKAFGFSDRTILFHYMGYGGVTGLAGGLLGILLGLAMAGSFTQIYLEFFHLPNIQTPPDPAWPALGLVIALGSGLLGALAGTLGVLRLSPCEAMRPSAPPVLRGDIMDHIPLLRRILTSTGVMAMRNISRNRFRSAFVVAGAAFSFAITAFMASYGDMFDVMMLDRFTKVELFDMRITLNGPAGYTAAVEATIPMEGVRRVEGMLELPAELRREHLKKSLLVTAVETDSQLFRLYDSETKRTLPLPAGGLVISDSLARNLNVKRGDFLTLRTPYTGEEDFRFPVLEIFSSSLGPAAYIRLDSLWEALNLPPGVNTLLIRTDEPAVIREALLDADNVAAVSDQDETKQMYLDMMDSYSFMIAVMQLAGTAIAFAIITNTASISLSERSREYATMRVLGMYPAEIAQAVSFEYWTLSLLALAPGILLTRGIKEAMAGMVDNDVFSMPVHTSPASFLSAAVFCGLAVALSNWSAQRKISRYDMAEVLRERE